MRKFIFAVAMVGLSACTSKEVPSTQDSTAATVDSTASVVDSTKVDSVVVTDTSAVTK